jgi:hypothetical protein
VVSIDLAFLPFPDERRNKGESVAALSREKGARHPSPFGRGNEDEGKRTWPSGSFIESVINKRSELGVGG